jgi:4'-phosphopantetheinyl transferase
LKLSDLCRLEHAGVELVFGSLDASLPAADTLVATLSDIERHRAAQFRFDLHRRRYIVARARLRCLLGERLQSTPRRVLIESQHRGKPVLGGPFASSGLNFNLSHCDELVIYAFAWKKRVGVDIERVRTMQDRDAVAERVFSPRERALYRRMGTKNPALAFFTTWTRKEAFLKATGVGLSVPLSSFDTSLTSEAACEWESGSIYSARARWRCEGFFLADDVPGAVVVERPHVQLEPPNRMASARQDSRGENTAC